VTAAKSKLVEKVGQAKERLTLLEEDVKKERQARVKERAKFKAAEESSQSRVKALEQRLKTSGSGDEASQKRLAEREAALKKAQVDMKALREKYATAVEKNKALATQVKAAGAAEGGGAEIAALRKKYNDLVGRYKDREADRRKLQEEHQKSLDQLQKTKQALREALGRNK